MRFIYRNRKWFVIIFVVILLAALIPLLSHLSVEDILTAARGSALRAALILLALYVIKPVAIFIPLLLLYISAGLLFPLPVAILLSMAFLVIEMTLSYMNGRILGTKRIYSLIAENRAMARFIALSHDNSAATCFVSRLSPLSFDLFSMFYGATKMPYSRYILFSLLGEVPKMIPYIMAGTAIESPLSVEFLLPFGIGICISVALFFITRHMMNKKDTVH